MLKLDVPDGVTQSSGFEGEGPDTKALEESDGLARDRTATYLFKGILYQALVASKMILEQSEDVQVIFEGVEDIDIVGGRGPGPTPRTYYQVKDTIEKSLDWGSDTVSHSILEFFINFSSAERGAKKAYVLLTPATINSSGRGIVAEWKEFNGERTKKSIEYFPKKLFSAMRKKAEALPEGVFRNLIKKYIEISSEAHISSFAHSVRFDDGYSDFSVIEGELTKKLAEIGFRFSGSSQACASVIIFQAARNPRDISARTFTRGRLIAEMKVAFSQGDSWPNLLDEITKAIGRLQVSVDAILENGNPDKIADRIIEKLENRIELNVGATRTGSSNIHEGSQISQNMLPEIRRDSWRNGSIDAICKKISSGKMSSAVALAESELVNLTNENHRPLFLYLKIFALSGIDKKMAADEAMAVADERFAVPWPYIFKAISYTYNTEDIPTELVERLESLSATDADDDPSCVAKLILADYYLFKDLPNKALEITNGMGGDIRAIKISIRANIELGEFESANALVNAGLPRRDPERLRIASQIRLKQVFKEIDKSTKGLPENFSALTQAACDALEAADKECPREAVYRRIEILGNMGLCLHWLRKPLRAIEVLKRAIAFGRAAPELHFNIAQAFSMINNYDAARRHAQIASESCEAGKKILMEKSILLHAQYVLMDSRTSNANEVVNAIGDFDKLSEEGRGRAKTIIFRAYLNFGDLNRAIVHLAGWGGDADASELWMCKAMLFGYEKKYNAALEIIDKLIKGSTSSLEEIRELYILKGVCCFNLGLFETAFDVVLYAIEMKMGVSGCDLAIMAAWKRNDAEAIRKVESIVLDEDPGNVYALKSRATRLFNERNYHDSSKYALLLGKHAELFDDLYQACAILWNIGDREGAALLCGQSSAVPSLVHHYVMKAESEWILGNYAKSITTLLEGAESFNDSRDLVVLCIEKSLRIKENDPSLKIHHERIKRIFARAVSAEFTPPILESFASSPEELIKKVRDGFGRTRNAVKSYSDKSWSTAHLADMLGENHGRVVYKIISSPGLNFNSGLVPEVSNNSTENLLNTSREFLLDLPSLFISALSGLLGKCMGKISFLISREHVSMLAGYKNILSDELMMSKNERGGHLTDSGYRPFNQSEIEAEIRVLNKVMASIDGMRIISPVVPDEVVEINGTAVSEHSLTAIQGEVTGHRIVPVLMDKFTFSLLRKSTLPFAIFLIHLKNGMVISESDYNKICSNSLMLGVERVGISMNMLSFAYERDGVFRGEWTNLLLGKLRETKWNKRHLCISLIGLFGVAIKSGPFSKDQFLFIAASILHGVSFDKKQKRKAAHWLLRYLHRIVDIEMREGWSISVRDIELMVRFDPMALDNRFPKRSRRLLKYIRPEAREIFECLGKD